MRGAHVLFAGWLLHDVEEACAFPVTARKLSKLLARESLMMTSRQSWGVVGAMGLVVGTACVRGYRSAGRSALYRATVAGLEVHVLTHLAMSAMLRSYTAGVLTAVPVMWPAAASARRELKSMGIPLGAASYLGGVALLLPAAIACQFGARKFL